MFVVSVVVTFHNGQKDMVQCLESIIHQSYKDIEVIMIDDGSEDDTAKICREYTGQYAFISYQYVDHRGVSVARNRGIELAKGEYVMFVDGDDFLDETIIEKLLQNMDDSTDIIACSCVAFDDQSNFKDSCHFFCNDREFVTDDEKETLYCQLLDDRCGQSEGHIYTAIGVPWGKLYRTSFLRENRLLFSEDLRRMQDNVFNMYAFQKARKVKYCDMPLYWYRLNHITSYTKLYPPEIYSKVASERHYFFTHLFPEYSPTLKGRIQWMYVSCCMGALKNIALSFGLREASQKMRAECENDLYREAIAAIPMEALSKKEKGGLLLMRKKHFCLLAILLRLKSRVLH